jgi:hypothetical protein
MALLPSAAAFACAAPPSTTHRSITVHPALIDLIYDTRVVTLQYFGYADAGMAGGRVTELRVVRTRCQSVGGCN